MATEAVYFFAGTWAASGFVEGVGKKVQKLNPRGLVNGPQCFRVTCGVATRWVEGKSLELSVSSLEVYLKYMILHRGSMGLSIYFS